VISKGVILAGGTGSRLFPATKVTNKHLLPVYDRPMIFYPLQTLRNSGIAEILIVSGAQFSENFAQLLGDGKEFNCRFKFTVQKNAAGIADALKLAEDFAAGENLAVILGDNIFEQNFKKEVREFETGAQIFLKKVPDAARFGVAEIDAENRVKKILEKPKNPPTDLAVTGFYLFDATVFEKIGKLKPSARGELEISDVNNFFIADGKMRAGFVEKFWSDAGTFESLFRASGFARENLQKLFLQHSD
jgi:glucose-1-phosphate thymidylyltransferase